MKNGRTLKKRDNSNKNREKTNKQGGFSRYNKRVTKKMNCNPIVKGKTIIQGSCFTKETILKLKNSYNEHHPNNKIIDTNPVKIWEKIKERLSHCTKEDCWLNIIKNKREKNK